MVVALHQLTAGRLPARAASPRARASRSRGPRCARARRWRCSPRARSLHGVGFRLLHTADPTPPLTDLPQRALVHGLGRHARLPAARLARAGSPGWSRWWRRSSCLGVAAAVSAHAGRRPRARRAGERGLAAARARAARERGPRRCSDSPGSPARSFLVEHRRLKRKRPLAAGAAWPSLEALDRAGAFAVAVGFPLLTLGVVTGALWQRAEHGRVLHGHSARDRAACSRGRSTACSSRCASARASRRARCALSSLAGFALLGIAVLGVELLA